MDFITNIQEKLYPSTAESSSYFRFAHNHSLAARIVLIPAVIVDSSLQVVKRVMQAVLAVFLTIGEVLFAPFSKESSIDRALTMLESGLYSIVDIPLIPIKCAWQFVTVLKDPISAKPLTSLLEQVLQQ